MINFPRSQLQRFGITVLVLGNGLGLVFLLQQTFALTAYPLLYAIVAVSAYLGSARTGLLATLFCTIAASTVLNESTDQAIAFGWLDSMRLAVFVLITVLFNLHRIRGRIPQQQRNRQFVQQQKDESFALLNAFLSSAPVGFAFLNCDRRYVSINDALAATHNLSIADHIGRTVWETLTPELAETVDQKLKEVLDTKQAIVNQETSDQKTYWLSTYFPVCSGSGELLGIGATILDITERKRNRSALSEALQRINSHVENTPLAIVEWDRDFRVIRWSGQAEAIFGWTADEVLGKHPQEWSFVPQPDQATVQAVMKRLINGDEQRNALQNRNYCKDGSTIVCEWYNSALFDQTGQIESVLSLVLDVTTRVQLQAEQQRVIQLEQAARAEAEQANRLKDEFLAVLSHELRSPLNPILGWSKLLQTKRLSEARSQEALVTIERNARLQAQLIEDLLDVSRIFRDKLPLKLFPVKLEFIVSAALETVRLTADGKAIQIETIVSPNVGQVLGDSARLQQVVWNLLSNAVKFTPERGRVTIRLDRIGSEIQLQVIDTGKGIKPEFLPYVFEYFRQEDGSTTRNFGGLGLGLALVHHIVDQHGGRVWAESAGEGQGATFIMRLPRLARECPPVDPPVQASLSQQLEAEPLIGLQILAIDNDPTMLTFVSVALRQAGANVIEAHSAVEAIEALQNCQPDLILSDVGMPNYDGYALIQHIRSIEVVPHLQSVPGSVRHIPAIALTAYAGEDNQQQAIESGFQAHLAKPVDPEQLIAAIVKLCTKSSSST
ncbi:PAS/PAC Sensor Hybrid histidine kinase [Leptolyngbya sp. NIES-3755]|nr:PAS/PAC Sensor Hybrid histidine kinase [Leptolyngbya sp. NIES-3755]